MKREFDVIRWAKMVPFFVEQNMTPHEVSTQKDLKNPGDFCYEFFRSDYILRDEPAVNYEFTRVNNNNVRCELHILDTDKTISSHYYNYNERREGKRMGKKETLWRTWYDHNWGNQNEDEYGSEGNDHGLYSKEQMRRNEQSYFDRYK